MQSLKLADLVENLDVVRVSGENAVIELEYQGSAHVIAHDGTPKRIVSAKHEFVVPLFEEGVRDAMELAMCVIVGAAGSRPMKLSVAHYADVDIRDTLRHVDGRGSWSMSARFLADPLVVRRLPRWMAATGAPVPEGWVIGVSTVDERRPVICVRHGGKVGFLARDPMVAGTTV